jgi:hypothetical protein
VSLVSEIGLAMRSSMAANIQYQKSNISLFSIENIEIGKRSDIAFHSVMLAEDLQHAK